MLPSRIELWRPEPFGPAGEETGRLARPGKKWGGESGVRGEGFAGSGVTERTPC